MKNQLIAFIAVTATSVGYAQASPTTCNVSLWKLGTPEASADSANFEANSPWQGTGAMGEVDLPKSGWTFQVKVSPNGLDVITATLKSDRLNKGELIGASAHGAFDSTGTIQNTMYVTIAPNKFRATIVCRNASAIR